MQDSLSHTPKVGVGQTPTNSIRKENEKVNTFEKNSSGNISNKKHADVKISAYNEESHFLLERCTSPVLNVQNVRGYERIFHYYYTQKFEKVNTKRKKVDGG